MGFSIRRETVDVAASLIAKYGENVVSGVGVVKRRIKELPAIEIDAALTARS